MSSSMRIGIFAGSFDPVHDGHIKFALAAIKQAKLDKVYFLVEAKPRYKADVSHLAHRLAMLRIAIISQSSLAVLDFPDRQFSVAKTLPRLNQKFKDDELFLLVGSDVLEQMPTWPLVSSLVRRMNMVVGLRHDASSLTVNKSIKNLPLKPDQTVVIKSPAAELSARTIREALLSGKQPKGLDPAVQGYIKASWLYASPSNSNSAS